MFNRINIDDMTRATIANAFFLYLTKCIIDNTNVEISKTKNNADNARKIPFDM